MFRGDRCVKNVEVKGLEPLIFDTKNRCLTNLAILQKRERRDLNSQPKA